MNSVFDLQPEERIKKRLVSQFTQWWSDNEIRNNIIPNIVTENLKPSIDGALKNYSEKNTKTQKKFAEILYDLVGQNFLVASDSDLRTNFLVKVLCKKHEKDSFQDQFFQCLVNHVTANEASSCQTCNREWHPGEKTYQQTLGLDDQIICIDPNCVRQQQEKNVPKIQDMKFSEFISKFTLKKNYIRFCRKLIEILDLPEEVLSRPVPERKLLPDIIKPLGNFPPLYDYQISVGSKIIDMLENYTIETSRAMVVLPTGAGKTRLVVETLVDWINRKKPGKEKSKFIVWIVDKNELCQQAFDTFADVFRHRGRRDSSLRLHPIYADHPKNLHDILYQYSDTDESTEISESNGVIIGTIQSLYKLSQLEDRGSLPELGKYTSIVVVDEAHHAIPSNTSYNAVLQSLGFDFSNVKKAGMDINKNKTCLLGLTATPFRGEDNSEKTRSLLNRFGTKKRILWPSFLEDMKNDNMPPYAHLDVQKTAFQGETVKLYGEGSYDRDGKITSYNFRISEMQDDGHSSHVIYKVNSEEKNIDYIFKKPGKHSIQLIVQDNDGSTSENHANKIIEIIPQEHHPEIKNIEEMKRLYKHLIERKILSTPHHYIINSNAKYNLEKSDEEQFKKFHDVTDRTIRKIGNDARRNHLIIEKIRSLIHKENRTSILLFACSISHSKLLSFILDAIYGIKSASIDYTTSPEDRDEIIGDFRKKKIAVLCNYDVLSTGFDSPKVDCVFITRPTFSHLLYNQMAGRGLRGPRSNGTSDCTIIDISDNIQLVHDKTQIEQPWTIFDYIYETVFDERKKDEEQICYGCFGRKKDDIRMEKQACEICNGSGKIFLDKPTKPTNPKAKSEKEIRELRNKIWIEHPEWDHKKINRELKRQLNYDRLLESKKA